MGYDGPGARHGEIRVGSTELSSFQRYRENTQKKKNSLFVKGALYWAPRVPGASVPQGSKLLQNSEYIPMFRTMF